MLKPIIIGLMLLGFWANHAHGQTQTLKLKIIDEYSEEAIPGALVRVSGTDNSGITNPEGFIVLSDIPQLGNISITIRMLGFESKKVKISLPLDTPEDYIVVALHDSHQEMETVTVNSTRTSRTIADIPTRIEFIAGEELDEKANMKPGDIRLLLSESTGIMVQITSPTSANASIRIQGLDGRYTQLLKDGFPLYSGAASGLSLLQIPPLDLKQVEVLKGSASTLYGGGAIAGLVNLISKTPTTEGETGFLINGTSAGGLDFSAFHGKRKEEWGTTLFAAYNANRPYDPADIGLSAIPKFQRYTFNPRLFYYPDSRTTADFGININYEDRKGGNMALLKNRDTGPNSFFEHNESFRINSQLSINHQLNDNRKLEFKNAVNFFDRQLSTNTHGFKGTQWSSFSEFNYQVNRSEIDWVFGGNVYTESFNDEDRVLDRSYSQQTLGVFAQNTWIIQPKWILETGLRTDLIPDYGWAILPRIALLWKANQKISSRFGGGLGYKTPTIFTEETERLQYQNVAPISPEVNVLERSYGLNWDVNFTTGLFHDEVIFSFNHLFFYTYLVRPLFLSPPAGLIYQLANIDGFADTRGVETNLKWEWREFKWLLGYSFTDARIVEKNISRPHPLTPKHRINSVLFYEVHDNWKVGWESYYFSQQKLGDGSIGQSYWLIGFMAEKIWDRVSIFINFENFLDARQTRFDSIFTGSVNNPEFREIYAPLDGFVINGGLKLRL
ncbi:TonB-dependent receptor domain-containing protein [Aquiflexum sp.]|uniref:TonB-dependent receptor n=1 Tax=Aquiflexum sp. TaxID=1872584 RepID=UPI0035940E62